MKSTIALVAFLGGCFSAKGSTPDSVAECSAIDPCVRTTGFSCEAGAVAELALPDGALVFQVVSVEVITAGETADITHDFIQPVADWNQNTLDQLFVRCPAFGEIVVYYLEM